MPDPHRIDPQHIEAIARRLHDLYCAHVRSLGDAASNDASSAPSALVSFDALDEADKQQNRDSARDLAQQLTAIGYRIRPVRVAGEKSALPPSDVERAAELEHARWMNSKRAAGWTYAPVTDRAKKQHRFLVPWEQVPEIERRKDRLKFTAIPDLFATLGLALERIPEDDPKTR